MKKILALFFLGSSYIFAKGNNIASVLADNVNEQISEAGKSIASIINTFSIVMGVLWIVVMLLTAFINIEAIKNHAKLLFGAVVLIGIIYGLSSKFM